jgi:hypothetical protein
MSRIRNTGQNWEAKIARKGLAGQDSHERQTGQDGQEIAATGQLVQNNRDEQDIRIGYVFFAKKVEKWHTRY